MFQFEKPARNQVFQMDGWLIWGSSVCKYQDKYYMFASAWERKFGFFGWVEHSTILKAVAERVEGPYTFQRELTELKTQKWSDEVLHCPTILEENGKFYLFYIGCRYEINERTKMLPNSKEIYRYNQQIGVAEITDVANGTFTPYTGNPILSPRPGYWDNTYVTNPAICRHNGGYYLFYKALLKDRLPEIVMNISVARADHILGPYERLQDQQLSSSNVEDPFIWTAEDGSLRMIAKDMDGAVTGIPNTALYAKSDQILQWNLEAGTLAYSTEVEWQDGKELYFNLESPDLYFEDGRPVCLFNAVRTFDDHSFNLARKIKSIDPV